MMNQASSSQLGSNYDGGSQAHKRISSSTNVYNMSGKKAPSYLNVSADENTQISLRIEAYDHKMRKAQELKNLKQKLLQQSAHNLNNDNKVQQKVDKEQTSYMNEFQRNVLKRAEVEKRKKKKDYQKQLENDYAI